jgi:hypothetical protein
MILHILSFFSSRCRLQDDSKWQFLSQLQVQEVLTCICCLLSMISSSALRRVARTSFNFSAVVSFFLLIMAAWCTLTEDLNVVFVIGYNFAHFQALRENCNTRQLKKRQNSPRLFSDGFKLDPMLFPCTLNRISQRASDKLIVSCMGIEFTPTV